MRMEIREIIGMFKSSRLLMKILENIKTEEVKRKSVKLRYKVQI